MAMENCPFGSMIFRTILHPSSSGDFPASHVWWHQRVYELIFHDYPIKYSLISHCIPIYSYYIPLYTHYAIIFVSGMTCPMSIALHLQALPVGHDQATAWGRGEWPAVASHEDRRGPGFSQLSPCGPSGCATYLHQNIVQSCTIQLTCLLMVL